MSCCGKNTDACPETGLIAIDRYIRCIIDMIKEKFNGEIDSENLYMAALKGIFDFLSKHADIVNIDSVMLAAIKSIFTAIDKYGTFHSYTIGKHVMEKIEGNSDDIGLTAARVGNRVLVCGVSPFSSAHNEGILIKDEIVTINGKCVQNQTLQNVYDLIYTNTEKAILGIVGNGEESITYKEIRNEKVKSDSVTASVRNNIGYIRISSFNKNTYEFVSNALAGMDEANVSKIILDLRNNCGGDVKQAALTAGIFVPEGLIAKLKFRSASFKDIEYHSHLKNTKYRLVVLINEVTASSSEILAGAIQDTKSGVLVGTNTSGKASVQKMIPILTYEAYIKAKNMAGIETVDADELKTKCAIQPSDDEIIGLAALTVGEYFTPRGRSIGRIGLSPDIYVDTSDHIKSIHNYNIKQTNKVFDFNTGDESMDIYYAKAILSTAGYRVGEIDGILDKTTADAIKKFQEDGRLNISGMLDIPTQTALNALLEMWTFEEDEQFAKAVDILEKE